MNKRGSVLAAINHVKQDRASDLRAPPLVVEHLHDYLDVEVLLADRRHT